MTFEVAVIVGALVLLMVAAYRGYPVILFAPLCAVAAAGLSGRAMLPSYTELFMTSTAAFVKSFFPLFLLGAVFGKLMETSGAAGAIAETIARKLGAGKSILAVVLACGCLTYGGVSLFVVAFAVYPLAAALFQASDIPKRLIPGTIALGAFTFTMDALPGSPQIQNIIPTRYFGTDIYAAPIAGICGGLVVAIGGIAWLEWRRHQARSGGEGYGAKEAAKADETGTQSKVPTFLAAISPLIIVLAANLILSRSRWSVSTWYPANLLEREFPGMNVAAVASAWALIMSLLLGIVAAIAIHRREARIRLSTAMTTATSGALLAIFNTASEVGFGNVVKTLPGFRVIQDSVFMVSRYVLISEAAAVNVLAGITGSASGGLSLALDVMATKYLALAETQGISPELLHRVASMASGGMDTLPHNGAVITLLAITGLTHRQAYRDIFAITVLKTLTVFALATIASII